MRDCARKLNDQTFFFPFPDAPMREGIHLSRMQIPSCLFPLVQLVANQEKDLISFCNLVADVSDVMLEKKLY